MLQPTKQSNEYNNYYYAVGKSLAFRNYAYILLKIKRLYYKIIVSGSSMYFLKDLNHNAPIAPSITLWSQLMVTHMNGADLKL